MGYQHDDIYIYIYKLVDLGGSGSGTSQTNHDKRNMFFHPAIKKIKKGNNIDINNV